MSKSFEGNGMLSRGTGVNVLKNEEEENEFD
ncbi:hypothetical protein J2Z23_004363 [Lederbergia galactosidilyticus]|nr:hypothetical protein [Lederbergia galactosidilytica]